MRYVLAALALAAAAYWIGKGLLDDLLDWRIG